jgi:ribosomal protein S18 acetylase RimI-like enzyme
MITIRPYQPKDRENVRRVCCHLKPEEALDEAVRGPLLTIFCDYYIDCEPQNCFVAADENDIVVAYVYCAENYKHYRRRFMKEYAPKLKGQPFSRRATCWSAAHMPIFYARKFPAHLHIDVLGPYQRMGLGHQLIDALAAHLRANGVPGVMLVVGRSNVKGRNFYEKYGFKRLRGIPFTVVMGLEL